MQVELVGNYIMRHSASPYFVNQHIHHDGYKEYITSCGIEALPLAEDLSSFFLSNINAVIDRVNI